MKRTRTRALIATLALCGLALTGCGGGGSSNSSGSGSEEPTQETSQGAKKFSEIRSDLESQVQSLKSFKLQTKADVEGVDLKIEGSVTTDPSTAMDMTMHMKGDAQGQKIDGAFKVLLVEGQMFVAMDDDMLKSMSQAGGQESQMVNMLKGKYMIVPSDEVDTLDFTKEMDDLKFQDVEDEGEPATVNGTKTYKYKLNEGDNSGWVYVDAKDNKTLVAVDVETSAAGKNPLSGGSTSSSSADAYESDDDEKMLVRMSEFNKPVKVEKPPKDKTVDMSSMGR